MSEWVELEKRGTVIAIDAIEMVSSFVLSFSQLPYCIIVPFRTITPCNWRTVPRKSEMSSCKLDNSTIRVAPISRFGTL